MHVPSHLQLLESCLVPLSSTPPLPRSLPGCDCSLTQAQGTYCHPHPTHPGTTAGPGFTYEYVLILYLAAGLVSLCPPTQPRAGGICAVDRMRRAAGAIGGRDRMRSLTSADSSPGQPILPRLPQVLHQGPHCPRPSRGLAEQGKLCAHPAARPCVDLSTAGPAAAGAGQGGEGAPRGRRAFFLFKPEATVLSTSGLGTILTAPAGQGGDFSHLQSAVTLLWSCFSKQ